MTTRLKRFYVLIAAILSVIVCNLQANAGSAKSFLEKASSKDERSVVFNTNRDGQKTNQDLDYIYYRDNYIPNWHSPITNLPSDWVRFAKKTPLPWITWPVLAGLGALTTILVATDYETWQFTSRSYHTSPVYRKASDMLEFMGDGKFQFGIVGVYAGCGSDRLVMSSSVLYQPHW